MTSRDQNVFLKAAKQFNAWILVRQTNPRSLQYKGKRLYEPKPINCKPKTADRPLAWPNKQVDGLVVDPFRWPEAFSGGKIEAARELWTEFRLKYGLGEYVTTPEGFKFLGKNSSHFDFAVNIEPTSPHEGCLSQKGKYLYGDFDLFDIVFVGRPPRIILPGQSSSTVSNKVPTGPQYAKSFQVQDSRDEDWDKIADYINTQLGAPMIQHGSQFLYKPGVFEPVEAFGPDDKHEEWSATEAQLKYKQLGRV